MSTASREGKATLRITMIYSPGPRQVREWFMELPQSSTIAGALAASQLFVEFPAAKANVLTAGVWGHKTPFSHVLQDLDRVEIYRDLRVDPKVARRERFSRQGVKRAGLFSKTRDGGKAGY